MGMMHPSSVLLAATRRSPRLRRRLLRLAFDDRTSARLRDHWVVQAILQQESPDAALSVRRQGFRVFIPVRFMDSYISRPWEPMTSRRLRQCLAPGMTFVDVGAHVGHYTLLAARAVGRSGRVVALEPASQSYRLLRETVRANRLRQVTVLPVAAGAKSERRAFNLTSWSLCQGFYEHPDPVARPSCLAEVDVQPLDELITGSVNIIKIDVEGAELEVLDGMSRILDENPTLTLIAEWHPECLASAGRDPRDLPKALTALGFRLDAVLDPGVGTARWPEPVPVDLVFRMIRDERLPRRWYGNLWAQRGTNDP
jgi:FkbM family methyltransferase